MIQIPIAEDMIQYDDNGLLRVREQINYEIEELEAARSVIADELLARLSKEKLDGKVVGEYAISRVRRLNFKTKLEDARLFGAVIEAVDTKKLKELKSQGIDIPDVTETEYLLVRSTQTPAEKENS